MIEKYQLERLGKEIYSRIPEEIKQFWNKKLDGHEKIMFEADPYYDAMDASNRFTIFKVKVLPTSPITSNKTYLARGGILNNKCEVQYLFNKNYVDEAQFVRMLRLKIFW